MTHELAMYTPEETKKMVVEHLIEKFGVQFGQGKSICEAYDLSASIVSLMMNKKVVPPKAVLKSMGIKKITMYVKEQP